jgi:hypothetical protein
MVRLRMTVVSIVVMRVVVIMVFRRPAVKSQDAENHQHPCAVEHQKAELAVFVKQINREAQQKSRDQNANG